MQGIKTMDAINDGMRAISLLVNLNWDRMAALAIIVLGLWAGAWMGTTLAPN